jgi:hypothetical protein
MTAMSEKLPHKHGEQILVSDSLLLSFAVWFYIPDSETGGPEGENIELVLSV